MDAILPNAGTYKVNAHVDNVSLDDCSLVGVRDNIRPYFEDDVSGDPDVTGLMVFLRNSRGEIAGWKVLYNLAAETGNSSTGNNSTAGNNSTGNNSTAGNNSNSTRGQNQNGSQTESQSNVRGNTPDEVLINDAETEEDSIEEGETLPVEDTEDTAVNSTEYLGEPPRQNTVEYKNGDELIIPVRSLDDDLPFFPVPDDLPPGWYTLVSQVMSGNEVLQKTEKLFFFLADTGFSFDNIQVHLPGMAENSQLIPNGTVIMLEAALNFDSHLDPYIVWYYGKKKVVEGKFSEGTGTLLWNAPEQNGFFSLRAEAFPTEPRQGIAGYINEVSLLVSSKAAYLHLIPEDVPELIHWYTFEGSLDDSKARTSTERALKPAGKNSPQWIPSNGVFGLVTGSGNAFTLPNASFTENESNTRQILFRFKPLNNGRILAVQFGTSNVALILSKEDDKLILTLTSSSGTVSESFTLLEPDAFITADIIFSVLPEKIMAKFNVHNHAEDLANQSPSPSKPISLDVKLDAEYTITLGYQPVINASENQSSPAAQRTTFTAFWDEFALYSMPSVEVETEAVETDEQELPQVEEQSESGEESVS